MTKKTTCINFYAGPGAGKSTVAASVFAEFKKKHINCELITEFAKRKVWEGIMYSMETVDGVRGFNIPVTVRYDEGKWKAFHKGDELELKAVYQYEKKQIQ